MKANASSIKHLASHIRFACSIRSLINDKSRSNLSAMVEKNKVSMKIPLQSVLCLEYTARKSEKMGNISGKSCMHASAYDSYKRNGRVWLLANDCAISRVIAANGERIVSIHYCLRTELGIIR